MAFSPVFLLFFPSDKLEIPLAGGRMKNSPMVFFFKLLLFLIIFLSGDLMKEKNVVLILNDKRANFSCIT